MTIRSGFAAGSGPEMPPAEAGGPRSPLRAELASLKAARNGLRSLPNAVAVGAAVLVPAKLMRRPPPNGLQGPLPLAGLDARKCARLAPVHRQIGRAHV